MSYALDVQKFLDRAEALFPTGTVFAVCVPQPGRKVGDPEKQKVWVQGGNGGALVGVTLDMLAAIAANINKAARHAAETLASDPDNGLSVDKVLTYFEQLVTQHEQNTEGDEATATAAKASEAEKAKAQADALAAKLLRKGPMLRMAETSGMPIRSKNL